MDTQDKGYINLDEFLNYFTKVIMHWSSLVNKSIRVNKEAVTDIFNKIDTDKKQRIYCKQYSKALILNPKLLDWYLLLSQDRNSYEAQKLK